MSQGASGDQRLAKVQSPPQGEEKIKPSTLEEGHSSVITRDQRDPRGPEKALKSVLWVKIGHRSNWVRGKP